MKDAGRLLRERRLRYGLTQERLALRAGTSQAAISRIEAGRESVTVERLNGLLLALGEELDIGVRRLPNEADPVHLAAERRRVPESRLEGAFNTADLVNELLGAAGRRRR